MAGALIVTAEIAPSDLARLDRLRRAHYPPDRNQLPAHLTMFHALAPSAEGEVRRSLGRLAAEAPPRASIEGLMNLGGGVAFRVARVQKTKGLPLWHFFRPKSTPPHQWIVLIRLGQENRSVIDYVTMPTRTLSAKHHRHVTFTAAARDRLAFDCFDSVKAVARSLHRSTKRRASN